jgi:uncharacterized membrane protein YbhN (UPF0104 family)
VFIEVTTERGGERRRWWRAAARLGVAAALLVLLGLRIGGSAFSRGIGALTVPVIVAAVALSALSTGCAAWRWWAVARQLGAPLPAGRAVAAYYRSQFLNSVLPGGVVGDAHRAVAHGHDVDDVGRAARAVVWERTAGQIVQAVLTIGVLVFLPSPGRRLVPILVLIVAIALVAAWYLRRGRRRGSSWPARVAAVLRTDLRAVLRRPVWPVLVVSSVGVVVSHVALFVLVAHAVDPAPSVRTLVPLAVIVQIVSGIPLSVGGWGLREGTAAWVFAAAGLGAATGVGASAAYGVASLIALTPGAAVLGAELFLRRRRPTQPRGGRARPPVRHGAVLHG